MNTQLPITPPCPSADFLPLLVVGMPGVPGYNAFYYFRALFPESVVGIFPPPYAVQIPDAPGTVVLDGEDPAALERLFQEQGFRAVVDASGWCALKSCEFDPAMARRLNVDIGTRVMETARRHGARLIRLSTDLVFDGLPYLRDGRAQSGGYREDWPVSPVTVYGKMMAESERIIAEGYPEAAMLRIALPMGPSLNGHAGAIDWIASRFRKGRPATLYYDEVRSSLYVQDLNRVLLHFLGNDARGIFHAGGPRALSLYQIAQVINYYGGYAPELLMGCLRSQAGPMPPRAGDVSMDTGKIRALLPEGTLRPWPLRPDLALDRDWHARKVGSPEGGAPPGGSAPPEGGVAECLYGAGWPAAWDHPLRLIPGLAPTRFPVD